MWFALELGSGVNVPLPGDVSVVAEAQGTFGAATINAVVDGEGHAYTLLLTGIGGALGARYHPAEWMFVEMLAQLGAIFEQDAPGLRYGLSVAVGIHTGLSPYAS